MIVIDENPRGAGGTCDGADVIRVRDLLAACAGEAGRLAAVAGRLDASMGAMLSHLARAPVRAGPEDPPVRTLAQELQDADRLRQELSGLARALDLAVTAQSMSELLSAAQVRACTPLGALQDRLLSGRTAEVPRDADPEARP